MRKFLFLLTFSGLATVVFSQQLNANFSFSTFNSPTNGPFIETYLLVKGSSLVYKPTDDNKLQAVIEITYIFKQHDSIIDFRKYNVNSPIAEDSLASKANFYDLQRISLPSGKYDFEISLRDVNSNNKAFTTTNEFDMDYNSTAITISDIELIESITKSETKNVLTKGGYDLLPYTSDFFSEEFEKIFFYAEIYNTQKKLAQDEPFLIDYYIESFESKQIIGNFRGVKRETPKPVNTILTSFDIKKLPSGNYNLVIEIKNKENQSVSTKKTFFQRSNPSEVETLVLNDHTNTFVAKIPTNELTEHINSLKPISTQIEQKFVLNQLSNNNEELMRQYFYNFWYSRNNKNPEEAWNKYAELVKIAESIFSTSIKKGYETDRGRIFLKYGKPNTLSELSNEASSYPYEIWHYYGIEGRSNVKFIFYNPDVISNDYPLLHSNLPGEIYNAQWRMELHKRTNQPRDFNEIKPREYSQDKTDEYFALPK